MSLHSASQSILGILYMLQNSVCIRKIVPSSRRLVHCQVSVGTPCVGMISCRRVSGVRTKLRSVIECSVASPEGVCIAVGMAYLCHGVCLIQYEKLVWRARVACHREADCCGSKSFDFVPDHRNASLITGIEFHHTSLHQLRPENNRTVSAEGWCSTAS